MNISTDRQAQLHLQEILKNVRLEPWSWRRVKAIYAEPSEPTPKPPEPPPRPVGRPKGVKATKAPKVAQKPVKLIWKPIKCSGEEHEHKFICKYIGCKSSGEIVQVLTGPQQVRDAGFNVGLLIKSANNGTPYRQLFWRFKKVYRLV
jgi:hypothetical protein